MCPVEDSKTIIRSLNDLFRRTGIGGHLMVTAGINALPASDQAVILTKVRLFDAFTSANDPHGEHDFGTVNHNGRNVFFKIDYYDRNCEYGSEDPADPSQTTRVMTVMFGHEY